MTHRLVIVRHGNTFEADQPPRRIGARTDPELTAAGRSQAEALALHFAAQRIEFDRVLTGPLRRTRDTANIITVRQHCQVTPELADFLIEIDHGVDENALEDRVEARIGHAALAAWEADGICPPGWSDDRPTRLAAWRALAAAAPPTGATLLVTSNGAARFALMAFALTPPSRSLRTGAWGTILINGASVSLEAWNVRP